MSFGNLSRAEAQSRSASIKVERYDVLIDLSQAMVQDPPTFPVTATVTFTTTTPDTWLDFLDGEVESVTVNDDLVAVEYDGARIQLHGLRTGEPNVVQVIGRGRYSRSGQGLHRFVDPVDGEAYLYTQYEPADSRRVYPLFEQPDLKARQHFTLIGPDQWELLSNQPAVSREPAGEGLVKVDFADTPLLSTYITALAAGPYERFSDEWSRTIDGETLTIPLSVLCRRSLAQYMEADEFLALTKQGLDFYHDTFGFPYPWGKYDSILVPEYNLGAMENPGLVTFTEGYLFRSKATRAQYAARANVILHEMCHMWFGDLVTPKWWDDLWLKESFAEYMGAHASAAATQYTEAWVNFGGARKQGAYAADQMPTTHPITADIVDLEAAKQNFDRITYAKGASVLRQLVAYVGVDEFFEGSRHYFREHQFSSTGLADLLSALEKPSGRDLSDWSRRWLQTAGVDQLWTELETDGETITALRIGQESKDALTGEDVARPHRLQVGLFSLDGDVLSRTRSIELDVPGHGAEVSEAVGQPLPDLILVNDGDLTFAKARFDDRSRATAIAHVGDIDDDLARLLVWRALWDMTRDGDLPARDYIDAIIAHAPKETGSSTLSALLMNAAQAIGYTPAAQRADVASRLFDAAEHNARTAEPGSDRQLVWARWMANYARHTADSPERVRAVLNETDPIPGLALDPDVRWNFLRALTATGAAGEAEVNAELERDHTNDGITNAKAALAGRPDAAVKAATWEELHTVGALPNDHVDAEIAGFMVPLHAELTDGYADRYFDTLEETWANHPIEIAMRLVRGLYPEHTNLDGNTPEEHPWIRRSQAWLDAHPDAPGGLRRLVVEQRDHVLRALRAQDA